MRLDLEFKYEREIYGRLSNANIQVDKVEGDGNCFYTIFNKLNETKSVSELRILVATEMEKRVQEFYQITEYSYARNIENFHFKEEDLVLKDFNEMSSYSEEEYTKFFSRYYYT